MDPDLLDLPLGVKIYVKPKSKLVLCRGKLGEKLHGLSPSFNLDDPYMHHLNLQYNCLHDPHLQDYHKRKDVLQMLKKQGFVTSENKVICTVKEFNEYRQYLTRIKMESEQILGQEKVGKALLMDPDLLDLPLGVKIYVKPKSKLVLCRGKLGEKLHGLSPSFNLDDPYMHHLNLQYNCLHDPHLQDYHKRKDVLQMLKKQGFVTSENKVICTVKEFNEYRQYLTRIKMESEQILGQEKKSKETTLKSGRFRRGKGALDKGQTNSTAELGQQDASRAADSKRKPDNTSDGLFKAVLEKLTMAEAQKLQELVKTIAYKVFVRLKVPGDQRVSFLRKTAQGIRGNGFGSSVKTEPAETPLDHRRELEMVAKELLATVLEILGNRLESKASEPGRAARQKEKPVDGGATQAETSKEAETGRERIHACLDDLTIQVVKHVHCLLKSMTAAQFRGDSSCEYTEILKLPKGKVSNRQRQQAISGSSKEQSQKASTGVKLPALGPQLRAKGTGYAKTMEPEDSAMVKESLDSEQPLQQPKQHDCSKKLRHSDNVGSSPEIFPDAIGDLSVFSIKPYCDTIYPGQKQAFQVWFSPKCPGMFQTTLQCRIPNLKPTQKTGQVIVKAWEQKSLGKPLEQTEKGQGAKKQVLWKPAPKGQHLCQLEPPAGASNIMPSAADGLPPFTRDLCSPHLLAHTKSGCPLSAPRPVWVAAEQGCPTPRDRKAALCGC
ncbi:unnamed protein product [Coccothraustes coccothraustes]